MGRSCWPCIRLCGTGWFQEQGQCFSIDLAARSLLPFTVFPSSSFGLPWYRGAVVFRLIGSLLVFHRRPLLMIIIIIIKYFFEHLHSVGNDCFPWHLRCLPVHFYQIFLVPTKQDNLELRISRHSSHWRRCCSVPPLLSNLALSFSSRVSCDKGTTRWKTSQCVKTNMFESLGGHLIHNTIFQLQSQIVYQGFLHARHCETCC